MAESDFTVTASFPGGNLRVLSVDGDTVSIAPDLRDSDDWFYWAFCVENAAGLTLTFDFGEKEWVGYYGAAVSHDYETWAWQGACEDRHRFTYSFAEGENKVYFAHDILYRPEYFTRFADARGFALHTFCRTRKGRDVPYVTFGEGDKVILMTARHHACESTGNYVLEGVLERLQTTLPGGFRVFCIPFVDYDGVVDGDQGKARRPHDHNRDYSLKTPQLYPETAAIMAYGRENRVVFGLDFHSPWHISGCNDTCFIVQKSHILLDRLVRFGELLEQSMPSGAFPYTHAEDVAPDTRWNHVGAPCFATFAQGLPHTELAFTLETAYFGKHAVFSPEGARLTGHGYADALCAYIRERNL